MKKPKKTAIGKPEYAIEAAIKVIQGKWKGCILYFLLHHGRQRFNAILRYCPDVTQRMLTKQLRELEAAGLVSRTIYAEVPIRVEYRLTDLGTSLAPILAALRDWGDDYTAMRTERPKKSRRKTGGTTTNLDLRVVNG